MSLLIKALDKAEKAQLDQQKLEQAQQDAQQARRRSAANIANEPLDDEAPVTLSLTDDVVETTEPTPSFVGNRYAGEQSAERATNMFAAKVEPRTEMKPIVWIVLFGVLGFLAIVGYFYYQLNVVNAPPLPIANPPVLAANATSSQQPSPTQSATLPSQSVSQSQEPSVPETPLPENDMVKLEAPQPIPSKTVMNQTDVLTTNKQQPKQNAMVELEQAPLMEVRRTSPVIVAPAIASPSASIQVSKSQSAPAIHPNLTNAYNAYLAGNHQEAQALYKRVLQRDMRNVDALLGMGAIAEREGRTNDALGWYQKVLEVEPKNAIALSAYAANMVQDDQASVAKFRKILQDNPNDANAHANLGAYYAGQSQWAEAQQSYFEAYRLNATAENAFNLAVSLDQMGKPALALPYYQQALAQVAASPSSTIDISALQARITAIQSQ